LGESGDGFPNGAPDGVDPFEVLSQMSMRGICIYSVGCEPALSGYQYAKDFFVAAAQKTNGQAVSLRSAAALADVIMGGAIEEMDLQQLADEVVEEVKQMRAARSAEGGAADGYDSDEERSAAWVAIQSRGHQTRHMQTKKLRSKHAGAVCKASSLSEARETLQSCAPSAPVNRKKLSAASAPMAACGLGDMELGSRGRREKKKKGFGMGLMSRARSKDVHVDLADDVMEAPMARGSSLASYSLEEEGDGGSGRMSGSDSDDDFGGVGAAGGVRLETRALSFSQVGRIYGRQKNMGVL